MQTTHVTAVQQDPYWVLLRWGDYHRLNAWASAEIAQTPRKAIRASEDASDEVIGPLSWQTARRAALAFREMAQAAWTPNQDSAEYDRNGRVIAAADRILKRVRTRAEAAAPPAALPIPLALPSETLPAPRLVTVGTINDEPQAAAELGPLGGYWQLTDPASRPAPLGLVRRYAAGLQSLLDRPNIGLRVRVVIPRTGKGGGFVVVARMGDDLRAYAPAQNCPDCGAPLLARCQEDPAPVWCHHCHCAAPGVISRLAEAELTFVLRRASSGSGRLMLNPPCRRDPDGGRPFPRPYGRLTVLGSQRMADGGPVLGGGPVATRWWLANGDAERLLQRRVLPELAWQALEYGYVVPGATE